ncbi:MAG: hypothetical protein IIA44_16020, partial [Acidobacteria bacterium]|nr:hypothetical protein [Acidobacteriota bacterium]
QPAGGEQRFVVAIVNFQAATTENVTVSQVEARMLDPIYSADQWWQENSYGKTWATGDVFGWITLPMDRGCPTGAPGQWRTLTIAALDGMTDLTQYNRLYILIPGAGGCGWGGLGTLGSQTFSTSNGNWTTTTSWTRSEYFNESLHNPSRAVFVTVHEFGHNFARHHSEAIRWDAGRSLGPFDCEGCESTVTAYGDRFCSLGGSWNPGHFSAMHKLKLFWFEPENVVDVTRSGVYEIDPYAISSTDPKVLRIHRGYGPVIGHDEYILVEWRQPIGYDTEINYSTGNAYDGVTLHYDFTHGARSYNPDMTPGDSEMRNAALEIGQTWDDLYTNVSISPLGVVDGMMQIDVKIGTPVLPTSYRIVRGFHEAGGLTDLNESDDQRLEVKAGLTLFAGESPLWVEFETTIPGYSFGPPLGAVRFEVEAKCMNVTRQTVQMFNYATSTWDTIEDGVSAYSDTFVEANVWSRADRYIDASTGEMRARVQRYVDRLILVWSEYYVARPNNILRKVTDQETGTTDEAPCRLSARVSDDRGRTWSERLSIQENLWGRNVKHPNMIRLKNGDVLLTFSAWESDRFRNIYAKRSSDNCETWGEIERISEPGWYCTNNDHIVRLKSGRILLPSHGGPGFIYEGGGLHSSVFISDDDGSSWTLSKDTMTAPGRGAHEPSIVELNSGRLLCV